MEISVRSLWTMIHGIGFGALYLLAFSGAVVELRRRYRPIGSEDVSAGDERFLRTYLIVLAVLAWVTVLTGTYIIYPWYRAVPPAGTMDLAGYPQRLLLSHASTAGWHSIGMEWKEHIAWIVPIATTMAAAVFARYGRRLKQHSGLRNAVTVFLVAALFAAAVAGLMGAMLNKNAPVAGGAAIHIAGQR